MPFIVIDELRCDNVLHIDLCILFYTVAFPAYQVLRTDSSSPSSTARDSAIKKSLDIPSFPISVDSNCGRIVRP